MCLIMGMGRLAGLLLTGMSGSTVLDIMTGNRSVLVQSFMGIGGCEF